MCQDIGVAYAQFFDVFRVFRASVVQYASQNPFLYFLRTQKPVQDLIAQDLSVQMMILLVPGFFDQRDIMQ